MKKKLIDNYATSDVDASEAVRVWFEVYGKRYLKNMFICNGSGARTCVTG